MSILTGQGQQRWDALYQDIKNNGYKSQKELGKKGTKEVEVLIGRNGDIIFRDGNHRLSIAKILGIQKIPVIVNVWHEGYINWVKEEKGISVLTPTLAIKFLDERLKQQTTQLKENK